MWIRQIFLGILGFAASFIVAGGVFALITSVGIVTRLAGKTHTGKHVKSYETAIVLGATVGNMAFFYPIPSWVRPVSFPILLLFGAGAGIYVGCLATALAELLNTSAIFTRRMKLIKGFGGMVLCVALGKLCGSLLQFYLGWAK